jgi:hypothetical protein
MAIELKNALAAWKKAKPLTLTKTGVSEVLRNLPADPSIVSDFKKDIPALETIKKTLEVAVANKHIQAQKKAHECIKEILTAVNNQLAEDKVLRGKVNAALKKVFDGGHAFLKTPTPQVAATIKQGVVEYNTLLAKFQPKGSQDFFQVPPRVSMLAQEWVKQAAGKDPKQFEGVKKEMIEYMKAHPMMAA